MTAEAALARAVLDSTGHPLAALGRGGLELNRGSLELGKGWPGTGQHWAVLGRTPPILRAGLEDAKLLPRLCLAAPVYLFCKQVCKGNCIGL